MLMMSRKHKCQAISKFRVKYHLNHLNLQNSNQNQNPNAHLYCLASDCHTCALDLFNLTV